MIGLNGSLVALLLIAYFVLIACALSLGCPTVGDDHATAPVEDELELDRRRRLRSHPTTRARSELPVVVAYTRSTIDHEAESRRAAYVIGATVMTLQRAERRPCRAETHRAPRAVRATHSPSSVA